MRAQGFEPWTNRSGAERSAAELYPLFTIRCWFAICNLVSPKAKAHQTGQGYFAILTYRKVEIMKFYKLRIKTRGIL